MPDQSPTAPPPGSLPLLKTERLVLRPWRAADLATVLDIYSRWDVARFLGRTPAAMTTRAQAEAALARWWGVPGPPHGVWAIVPRDGDLPVGSALMKLLPFSGSGDPSTNTEIGWHLHPDAWGHGYATEAGARLIGHAWQHGLRELFAVVHPQNTASQAVCQRLGMEQLGLTDDYYDVSCELFRIAR